MFLIVQLLALVILHCNNAQNPVFGDHRHTQPGSTEPSLNFTPILPVQPGSTGWQQERSLTLYDGASQALSPFLRMPIFSSLRIHHKGERDLFLFLIIESNVKVTGVYKPTDLLIDHLKQLIKFQCGTGRLRHFV